MMKMALVSRTDKPNFPSWQDPSVGRQRAAAWNAQRQDSFSTYEEVESLHSHQCSSLQSLDNSCCPSRLQSFGSTSSSLDQSHPQVDGGPWTGGIPTEEQLQDCQHKDQGSSLTSDSTQSASAEGGRSGHLKGKSRRSLIEDDEDEMNSSVAKWVDQTRAETARRRSHVGLPEDPPVRSHEAPEGGQQSSALSKERSLTALNMQCGDVIPGRSGRRMRLPNETDLELALRVESTSPVSMISRCASVDSSHSSTGSDHHPEGEWTIAENVLINLGFGGASIGIPNRFLKSWRQQVVKQRMEEVRRLLGNTTGNHLLQHLPAKPERALSPKEKSPPARKEDWLSQSLSQPSTSVCSPKSSSINATGSEGANSHQMEDAVMSRQRGADKAKLAGLRRSLRKAATVSSFGQTLSEISKQGPPNHQVLALQQGDQPPAARRSPGGGKYSPFHKSHKSSSRDRRRKYMKRQSSLPISLETLQEEDESFKPGMVKSKQTENEIPSARKHLLKPQSLEVGDEPAFHCKLKIVMEQPSVESREAMSRQGTTDVDVDEAIADVDTDKKDHKVSMEQYLVVKAIIDSKDSGFENEPSRTGSPQISPRSSEDETVRGTCSTTVTTAESKFRKARSGELLDSKSDSLLVTIPSKELGITSKSGLLTSPIKSFQSQLNSQKELPDKEELPVALEKSTPDTSDAHVSSELLPQTDMRDTKVKGRSFSSSSERRGPSLADIQDDFHLTIIEDEDDDNVFDSPGGSVISESVSACCQTSPTLHSPLLSPLSFLGSISEHSDGHSSSPEIFVMPSSSTVAAVEENHDSHMERRDSLESVMTTADRLVSDLPLRNLSQEISDGGLSIITEKEEEQGASQEPSDQVSVMDMTSQDNQDIPHTADNNKNSGNAGQNLFHYEDLHQNFGTFEQLASNPIEKSRNPFKMADSFYSSPHHSNVDFDFDATIEEDEDGEQYSDGESFSKVTFSEVTPMAYETSDLGMMPAAEHIDNNAHSKESQDSFSHLPMDEDSPDAQSAQLEKTEVKKEISSESLEDKSVAGVNSTGSCLQDNTNSDWEGFVCDDATKSGNLRAPSDAVILNKHPIPENDILNKAVVQPELVISTSDDGKSEEKFNTYEEYNDHCPHNSHPGSYGICTSLKADEPSKDAKMCNPQGNESQLPSEGEFITDHIAHRGQDAANKPDRRILVGDTVHSENFKVSDSLTEGGLLQAREMKLTSAITNHFLALGPTEKGTKPLDQLQKERHTIEEWKLGLDQPQIMRSTSVEAHLSYQRRKLRTLSERSTLYSDGMEPLLSGFGRVITERSSSSTEGFGSLGSDIFRRPLTVTETLQQVAAKLESHVRQRSLVSIRDEEGEEENEQKMPAPEKPAIPGIKGSAELDSTGERNCVAPEQNWAHQMLDDEGYEEVNTRDENDITVPIVDKATIKMSKNILVRKEAENSFKLLDKNMLQGNSACTATFSAVDTKVVGPNIQVDESSDDCKEVSKSDFTVLASTSADDFSGFTPKITTSSRRKSWQFQATTCRKSSNFLSVPSFGPLTDSISGNPLSASPSTTQLNSEVGLLQEMVPVTEETLEYSKSEGGRDQNMSVPSGFTDTGDVPQTADLQVSCDFVMGHVNDEKYQNSQDKSTVDLCTETGTEQEGQNKSAQAAEFMKETHSILKRSPQSILVSFDLVDDALGSCEKDLLSPLDCAEMHSQPDLVSPTGSSVSEVDIERIQPASDFVSVQVLPTSNSSPSQCGAVVHSQFYKCEKFMIVSTSSDGRIDFAEAGEDDSKTCKSHRILTFRSEVKIPSLSSAWQRFSAQPAWGGSMSCSQTSLSLDCPSPVPASRLSPTFEEICSKAGKLMQQLQDALASEAPGNQMSPAATESRDNMGTDENESQPGEEEGEVRRYRLAKPYSRENDNHHPGDAARIKLESKRRKKKLLWDGRVKTSTPKANPGGRHQGDSGREMEGDVEEGTNNDHLATVRELLETETKMRRKLDELESSFEEVSSRKQDALTDLKRLREAVHRNKRDIQKAEEIARENMERADGLRSELMVLEYQRDQARRDLEDLTKSIGSIKQSQSHRGTEEVNAGTGTNLLGLSPKEVIAVIKERDELKTRLRNGEGDLSPIERSELERQLNHTKQELFSGQKSSREKLESLQEELEESRHTIEELLVEKTNLAEKVKELQATVGSEHTDGMHSDIEERNLLLEQLSGKLQKELDALRHQTHEKDQRLQSLAASVLEKDKLNDALRDQVLAAQREAEEGQRETERVVREAQGKMRNADVAKELALVELREALLREKEEEIEQLKLSLEKDKKEALTALDQKTSEMMRITQRSLSEKEEDLNVVKMQLVQHTEEANKMEQQLREQAEEQVQAAVEKERRAMEEEYTRRRREENVEKELEVAKETSRLQGELHVTKQRLEQMQTTVGVLKEELDKLREENLAAGREKVEAVSEAREKAREDIQRELDQLREQLAKENLLEADKLRMKIRQQEEEVTRLRSEVKVHQDREAKSAGVTGSKSILAEINEECKRTAAVIGSAPLKMNISRGSKSLNGTRSPKSPLHGMPDSAQGPGRTQVMAALTNLRISNEELRNYVQSLKADLERQKRALSKAQKEKDEEVKKVASTIEKKSGDMDTMRDRLIQDHLVQVEELQQQISRQRTAEASLQQRLLDKDSELKEIQQSMTQWKEETALKMAKKFEEELSKELEIRLQEASKRDGSYRGSQADLRSRNSSGNGSPSTVSSASDASTIRLLRHLQERVKQLRSENMSLRRSSRGPFESSGEERASPHSSKHSESDDKDHLLYQLQQRVKLLERQLQVAEERCRENAASVSEKISENSRLQGALTQQTKELMKMERAYSKLASPTRTPVRL
ncbi:uncharacterized protein LOC110982238 isoform X2 [Acanthaster planci]|uniref:Uncharacterized protein LOC110982238 isoform X2 n=1 Tax=Acanthaster planci TaxID=133434 RepID=A0A8B7YY84_ACAPL|nr:uncharacterized protein LOC110982238 isoform X2 [Acanthaster planci]